MVTTRGWWYFLVALVVLFLGLWSNAASVSALALSLLAWFLASWLHFQIRTIAVHGELRAVRQLADDHGPVQSLWAGRTFVVRVRLVNDALLGLTYVRIQERVPFGAQQIDGTTHAEGPLGRDTPLEIQYRIHCPTPGLLRFEGLRLQTADPQGFFYREAFVQGTRLYRILPALADVKGRFAVGKRHNMLPLIGTHSHRRPGSGSELLDLRDYQPGDPPRTIAWKASARRDRLMTKEFESEVPIRCTLFLDSSATVRVGLPGQNALTRLVELVAAIAQANTRTRDLTGLCLFDERTTSSIQPARSPRHLVQMQGTLADVANLAPTTGEMQVSQLLPLAYGLAQEVYPHLLESDVNHFPWWLPLWAPQPASTLRRPPGHGVRRRFAYWRDVLYQNTFARLAFGEWRYYQWRKQLAALLAARHHLGLGGLALLLEDDERFVLEAQRFLHEHHVPFEQPLFGPRGEYLFAAPAKVAVLAGALTRAVGRGRDNELFVLLVDLLEIADRLDPLLSAVKMAAARHHHVMVVCPWPPGVPPPNRSNREAQKREARYQRALADLVRGDRSAQVLELVLKHTTMLRLHRAFDDLRHTFARLGVPVLCARHDESVQLLLNRMEHLRVLERGMR